MNETRTLAEFVAGLRYEDLPQAVIDQACRIVADTVRHSVLIAELITNLASLAGRRAEFIFCPLNIADCDGAPARVLARAIAD